METDIERAISINTAFDAAEADVSNYIRKKHKVLSDEIQKWTDNICSCLVDISKGKLL